MTKIGTDFDFKVRFGDVVQFQSRPKARIGLG